MEIPGLKLFTKSCHLKRHLVRRSAQKPDGNFKLRFNPINIQMLCHTLHRQIFKYEPHDVDPHKLEKTAKSLLRTGLLSESNPFFQDINFPLPKLKGANIEKHFISLANEYSFPYLELAKNICSAKIPEVPLSFNYQKGWTKYFCDGRFEQVDYPDCDVFVFDVETCVKIKNVPVMAVALSDKYWYSWTSPHLIDDTFDSIIIGLNGELRLEDLIPFGDSNNRPRLCIGHNVSFDRSYIKEEYLADPGFMNFLDTMSFHILLSGYSDSQRVIGRKDAQEENESTPSDSIDDWRNFGSFNSLKEVAKFYLKKAVDKDIRNIFTKGSANDVRENFSDLIRYCANDVKITLEVFDKVLPKFLLAAPNPTTFAGMLMMSKCYLPITDSWRNYTEKADLLFHNHTLEMSRILNKLTHSALAEGMQGDASYKDPWLKSLEWSKGNIGSTEKIEKYIKEEGSKRKSLKTRIYNLTKDGMKIKDPYELENYCTNTNLFPDVPDSSTVKFEPSNIYYGYPKWFIDLINHPEYKDLIGPRPFGINLTHRITPIILKLSWNGFPVHFNNALQWCYVIPKDLLLNGSINTEGKVIKKGEQCRSYKILSLKYQSKRIDKKNTFLMEKDYWSDDNVPQVFTHDYLLKRVFEIELPSDYGTDLNQSFDPQFFFNATSSGTLYAYEDPELVNSLLIPIPHPSGVNKKCGNPLGSEYLEHFYSGSLVPMTGEDGIRFIQLFSCISFWRNNRDRICNHLLVYFNETNKPNVYKNCQQRIGAIVPRVIVSGTITRRAVETTWLTASNPHSDVLGTEQKSAIEAPPGFCFVGADVDSEEMWIASLIADSSAGGFHGSTPFSFMNLQGTKSKGTDLHSITASAIGINRDDAKILNYGRLYGAGVNFAKQMIKQYQPGISDKDATLKAIFLYNFTKGIQNKSSSKSRKKNKEPEQAKYWQGGTESEIFNILEHFTRTMSPRTPILDVSLSSALHNKVVSDDFMTSRMNWVVQSSAVDFLHLFLVSSFWLFSYLKVPGRLCLCVHDEIRFLIPEDKRYEAAFALHISNLYTRAAFSHKLGMHDLPQTVAFFSNVDIDKVLRKEPTMTCTTPSNPQGIQTRFGDFKCESVNIFQTIKKLNPSLFTEKLLSDLEDSSIFKP